MTTAEVIAELETGTPSPQRRRYLRSLLVGTDLEREPCCGDVDHQWCAETRPSSKKVNCWKNSPSLTKPMECTSRHAQS